jgi:pimeloyl-ACP methyl ester carboxylesterase
MKLVLLPGLGADGRLFAGVRCPGWEVVTPSFPDPAPRQSLSSYARALADRLRVGPGDAVGGASFGGFVAAEIAARRRVASLVLIGSALSPREVPAYYAVLERLSRWVPEGVFARAPRSHPLLLAKFGRLTAAQRALFLEMAGRASPALLRRGMRMIFGWKGVERQEIACPVHRIHGRLDRLIRPPSAREAELIEGGGHLISMTHPGTVGRFLAEWLHPGPSAVRVRK